MSEADLERLAAALAALLASAWRQHADHAGDAPVGDAVLEGDQHGSAAARARSRAKDGRPTHGSPAVVETAAAGEEFRDAGARSSP